MNNNSNTKKANTFKIILILQAVVILFAVVFILVRHKAVYEYSADMLSGGETPYTSLNPGSYNVYINLPKEDLKNGGISSTYVISDDDYVDAAMVGDLVGYYTVKDSTVLASVWLYHHTDEFRVRSDYAGTESVIIKETNGFYAEIIIYLLILFSLVDLIIYRLQKASKDDREEIRKNKVILIIFATTVLLSLPLMLNYLLDGHDLSFHLMRIEGIRQSILDGRFPARMDMFALEGQGYADPIYYPYLFLYIPAILRVCGLSIMHSYKFFLGFLNLAGCIIAYLSFKGITKNTKASIVGMIVYNLAPYHIACLYSRGALGEAQAYIFIPLIAYGVFKLLSKEIPFNELKKGVIALILGFSGILESHILSVEMTGIMLIVCLLLCIKRTFRIKTILAFIIAGISTLAINAWFIVPFVLSSREDLFVFHQMDLFLTENGLTLYQLLGAKKDLFGYSDYLQFGVANDIGISLGFALPLGILLCIYEFRAWKNKIREDRVCTMIICIIIGTLTAWMTTYLFPWTQIETIPVVGKLMGMVQFVWRYLGISTFTFTTAISILISILDEQREMTDDNANDEVKTDSFNKLKIWIYAVSLIGSTVLMCFFNMESLIEATNYYAPYAQLNKGRMIVQAEYIYAGYNGDMVYDGMLVGPDYVKDKDALIYNIDNETGTEMKVYTPYTYYSFYNAVSDNGEKLGIGISEYGTLYFVVPADYFGTIKVYMPEMKKWMAGDIISIISVIAFALLIAMFKGKITNRYKECNEEK